MIMTSNIDKPSNKPNHKFIDDLKKRFNALKFYSGSELSIASYLQISIFIGFCRHLKRQGLFICNLIP